MTIPTIPDTCIMHTTYRLLRRADACKDRYTVFRKAATALGYKGDTTPVPLTVLLQTNGLVDCLWALRAVLPGEEVLRDKGKVRVSVSLFGRPTSVELDYLQLKAH